MSPHQILVNEGDSIESIVRRVKSIPEGHGFFLTPSINKDLTGIWKPSEKERLDLLLRVIQANNEEKKMGLYTINCVGCNAQFIWFSGTTDQRCDSCRRASMTIKDHVKGVVRFQYFRDNQLFYKTDSGLVFPVPVEDIGNATFLAEDKAMLFMRYIRKFMESIKT